MLTRVSLGAAWSVAYTTPPIIAVWMRSDVKPTRSNPWLRVFWLKSRSEKTTDPPPVRRLSDIVRPHQSRDGVPRSSTPKTLRDHRRLRPQRQGPVRGGLTPGVPFGNNEVRGAPR